MFLSGISSIIIFEIRNRLVLLKNKSLNLSVQVLINSTFNVHNHHGIKLITRLRVGLSHLRERNFRDNFQDSLDPFCNWGRHIETTIHFFFTAQITQIKEKLFLKKLVTSNVLY